MFKLKSITTKQKAQTAASTFSNKGVYGSVISISAKFGVSRTTAYTWAAQAEQVLSTHFSGGVAEAKRLDLARCVLTLYTHGHASYDGIATCLEQITGQHISIGQISQIITEAGERALSHLGAMIPQTPCDVALDEIFGHGHDRAYLNIIDVHSYLVLAASGPHSLDKQTWQLVLWEVEDRGTIINNTISDGGSALLAGVAEFYPDRLHRRDLWHVFHAVQKIKRKMLRRKKDVSNYALGALDYLLGELKELLSVVVQRGGRLLCLEQRMNEIGVVLSLWEELEKKVDAPTSAELCEIRKQFRCVYDELLAFAVELEDEQEAVRTFGGEDALGLIGWAWQRRKHLGTDEWIISSLPSQWREGARSLFSLWGRAVRASSAVENWHSILRPHLAVHRRLSAGQLALLSVWHNYHVFSRGKHAGKRPLELAGVLDRPCDWLDILGYTANASAPEKSGKVAA